jgi:hypothetical protein
MGLDRRSSGRNLALAAAALLLALAPGSAVTTASASCEMIPGIAEGIPLYDAVVVGTVTGLERGGRWAEVRVEERWRTPGPLPDTIEIHGGPDAGTTRTDRVFTAARYLLFLTSGPGYYTDDLCTPTTLWTADLAAYRPAGVVAAPESPSDASPGPFEGMDLVPLVAMVAALVIAVFSYVLILRARRRPPDWLR